MEIVEKFFNDKVVVFKLDFFPDDRGYFFEPYNKKRYENFGITDNFVQDSFSTSKKGVIRGLHYQLKNPQSKQTLS